MRHRRITRLLEFACQRTTSLGGRRLSQQRKQGVPALPRHADSVDDVGIASGAFKLEDFAVQFVEPGEGFFTRVAVFAFRFT
jgi:hypothetical protein